jgi:hypothetical protein
MIRWLSLVFASLVPAAALAQTPTAPPDDGAAVRDQFEYGWSRAAEWIVYGTVVSVRTRDTAEMKAAHLEAVVQVDRVQRGDPTSSVVTVTIEDAGLVRDRDGDALAVGMHGLWFVNGVVRTVDAEPTARLLRVVTSAEIALRPETVESLLRWSLQDTVASAIARDAVRALVPANESARVAVSVQYGVDGRLADATLAERSGNAVLDDLVFDTVVYLHRRLTFPPVLKGATIVVQQEATVADTTPVRGRPSRTVRRSPATGG